LCARLFVRSIQYELRSVKLAEDEAEREEKEQGNDCLHWGNSKNFVKKKTIFISLLIQLFELI